MIVHTAKPGVLIGRKGENVKKLRQLLETLVSKKIDLEIKEIKAPDLDAYLVATNIAEQLERRISYQRAMKRAMQQAIRQGAEGIRVEVGGRLSGAEMARVVNMREGRHRDPRAPHIRRHRLRRRGSAHDLRHRGREGLDLSG